MPLLLSREMQSQLGIITNERHGLVHFQDYDNLVVEHVQAVVFEY